MTMKKTTLALAAALLPLLAHAQDAQIESKVAALMKQMTVAEKVGQLHQISGRLVTGPTSSDYAATLADIRLGKVGSMLNVKGVADTRAIQALALQSRLHIPLLFGQDVIHGYRTVFPVPLGESASWDMEAIEQSAHIAAREAAAAGIHWTFAPMVDVARDPRWGRVMEGAGEDAFLGSAIARARVHGFQGKQLGATDSVMATAKHFAAYGAAVAGRDYNAVDMSNQQLFEVYLPPFKAALDAGAATFMNSFNTLNGIPATANVFLQRDILKNSWNFKGFVVSDWGSVREMVPHGYASDLADASVKAINAGSDMDMESYAHIKHLEDAVKSGKVNMKTLDDAVRRILYKKFELGLFDDPYRYSVASREKAVLADPSHRAAALDVAQKSLVLLKNGAAGAKPLPLSRAAQKIAVIGPLADARRDLEGGWVVEGDRAPVVSILEGIRSHAGKAEVSYAPACDNHCSGTEGFAEAVATASKADVVVLAVGETWDLSGEAKSRTDITLPGHQEQLFAALKATGKPIVVVMLAGRPLVFNTIAEQADAIVYAWFPGSEGGNAVANVLFGDYNPSAKLPITFPRSVGQIPLSYAQYNTGRPVTDEKNVVYKSAYIDSVNTPRYAFGHGLSYTDFKYSGLTISGKEMSPSQQVTLSFDLANTGKAEGTEIVQLYLRDMVASVVRPVKELKGFQKIHLQVGEQRRVSFTIDRELLSFFNSQLVWGAEAGDFKLMVGSASDDSRLEGALKLLPPK
ncbi:MULTISPECIES: glycoside hydrolase family 3 N-terminal domain-containing protein [unclassified Duganella]|uniref:glycoside hydrolase family 3 N-terminal domain-containing protein n=1 Tax=unclassified Duganella TaxID=2636909 RepID=UPI000E343DAE|nr:MULTISPECIES: glycoside hydrolase family 3 N-terminal domain-containing protein [unclassified Duganella]RFP11336.1 glycosyl hydrolase [Duganella sp. BJB475]RFP29655.1 glycosyl hydrolase [Duganella sp. BJB476]